MLVRHRASPIGEGRSEHASWWKPCRVAVTFVTGPVRLETEMSDGYGVAFARMSFGEAFVASLIEIVPASEYLTA
jgi:hypothetical protein